VASGFESFVRDTPRGASPVSGERAEKSDRVAIPLRASGIARRRAEEERADTLFRR